MQKKFKAINVTTVLCIQKEDVNKLKIYQVFQNTTLQNAVSKSWHSCIL